jgi:HEAT repeat protein
VTAAPSIPEDTRAIGRRVLDLEVEAQRLLLARSEGRDATESPRDLAAEREKAAGEVAPLLERWRAAAPGEERAAAMKELAMPLFRLLDAGGPEEHLLVLEESAERGETAAERKWAVIAAHRLGRAPAVDFLLARTRSPHPEVRFYGVEGLAWVKGEERARAVEGVVAGLEDPEPPVRGIAALSLGLIVADPARAEAILERLGRETDPGAAEAMKQAVLRLDPVNGRDRVRAAAK